MYRQEINLRIQCICKFIIWVESVHMTDQNKQKSLSEVFKELERDKNKQVQIYKKNQKAKQESSFIFHIKHRTKKDNVLLVLIVLIFLFTFSLFSKKKP